MEHLEWIDFSQVSNTNATDQNPITLHYGHHLRQAAIKYQNPPSTQFTSVESIHETIHTLPSPPKNVRTNIHISPEAKQLNLLDSRLARPRILSVRQIKTKEKWAQSHFNQKHSNKQIREQSNHNRKHRHKLSLFKHLSQSQ